MENWEENICGTEHAYYPDIGLGVVVITPAAHRVVTRCRTQQEALDVARSMGAYDMKIEPRYGYVTFSLPFGETGVIWNEGIQWGVSQRRPGVTRSTKGGRGPYHHALREAGVAVPEYFPMDNPTAEQALELVSAVGDTVIERDGDTITVSGGDRTWTIERVGADGWRAPGVPLCSFWEAVSLRPWQIKLNTVWVEPTHGKDCT